MARPAQKSAVPQVRASRATAETPRCRLRTACDGATDGLSLQRIRDGASVRPTLCCPACAAGRTAVSEEMRH